MEWITSFLIIFGLLYCHNAQASSYDDGYYQELLAPFVNRRSTLQDLLHINGKGQRKSKCTERSKVTYTSPTTASIDVRFPAIHTTKDDTYMCTGFKIPFEDRESFIVKFIPHADMKQTHHMLIYGCYDIRHDESAWNCYEACQNQITLYAWARNAPELTLPKDVGYSIGPKAKIRYVVVEMHFAKAFSEPSCAGVTAEVTTDPQKYYAGIFLLGAYNINLPPRSANVPSNIGCLNKMKSPMHVFAFRTHAHELANVITGYRYRNREYKMIGKGNPKWPQSFYPRVGGEITLRNNDFIIAQCRYNNTRDIRVTAGPSGSDEMCNLYLMFYTSDKSMLNRPHDCWGVPYGSREEDVYFPPTVEDMPPYPGYAGQDSIDAVASGRVSKPSVPEEHLHHHHGQAADDDHHGDGDADDDDDDHDRRIEDPEDVQEEDEMSQIEKNAQLTDAIISKKLDELQLVNGSKPHSRGHGMPAYQGLQVDLSYPQLQSGYNIGAVGGIAAAQDGSIYVFHRAGRLWTASSFDARNYFTQPDNPIDKDTVYHMNKKTGKVLHAWGKGQFFMPHGASIDPKGFLWLTDVAMHQVFKYPLKGASKPLLALGVRLEPGSDTRHFCKPTDVAIDHDGTVFISDGYCNGRVMKFTADGDFVKQWGHMSTSMDMMSPEIPPFSFFIAHNIILCGPAHSELCVADRENGRIQCFTKDGVFTRIIEDKRKTGTRIFAITYSPLEGGVIFGVNGPGSVTSEKAGGFTIDYTTGLVVDRWQPSRDILLTDPHDISAAPNGEEVYVGDLTKTKIYKFKDVPSANEDTPPTDEESKGLAVKTLNQIPEEPPVLDSEEGHPVADSDTEKDSTVNSDIAKTAKGDTVKEPDAEKQNADNVKSVEENLGGNSAATVVIVCLVALPLVAVIGSLFCIRMRAKRLKEYESLLSPKGKIGSGRKSLNLGKFLKPADRKGFTRMKTEDSDDEGEDSDVEVYSRNEKDEESTVQ